MMKEYYYRIAGFTIMLYAPEAFDMNRLLPSFRPFRCGGECCEGLLYRFVIGPPMFPSKGECELVEESFNDLGYVRLLRLTEGYRVEVRSTVGGMVYYVHTDPRFTFATAALALDDPRLHRLARRADARHRPGVL